MTEFTPPERLEKKLLLKYINLDAETERMLGLKAQLHWPDWCYLPIAGSYAIATRGADVEIAQRMMAVSGASDLEALSAVIPWRLHKVIFRFDPDFAAELTQQDTLPDDIPAALLMRMPYPCVYIADPPGVDGCDGVFVFLEWDHRYPSAVELRMHHLFRDGEVVALYHQFAADKQALSEAFAANVEETARKLARSLPPDSGASMTRWRQCVAGLPKLMSMLVYLCSDEPDLTRASEVPRPRGRGAVRTPKRPDNVDVGSYIGSVIRMGRNHSPSEPGEPGSGSGAPRRPHMRRAHWHLYWVGEGRRTPRVKWLSPVFVHGEGQTPQTVTHPVKP